MADAGTHNTVKYSILMSDADISLATCKNQSDNSFTRVRTKRLTLWL